MACVQSRFSSAVLLGASALALCAGPAAAQQTGGLEEIVVTARRVSEALQDTPVSVTAYSSRALDRLNIVQPDKLAEFVPNLNFTQQPSSTTAASVAIRGIGEQEPSMAVDPRVGIYLDGVYVARTAGSIFDLASTERIEVLRGPQGTLFGRNTTGGAIQIVSKKPTDTFGVEQKLGYGTYHQWYTRSTLNTGLIGGLPIKATVTYQHRERNGYVDNTLTSSGDDPDSLTANSLWAAVHADIGDRVQVDYTFDWDHRNGTPSFFQLVAGSPDFINYFGQSASLGGAPLQLQYGRLSTVQQQGYTGPSWIGRNYVDRTTSYSESLGHALTVQFEASDELTIKSITAYRSFWQDTALQLTGNGVLKGVVLDPVTFAPSIQTVYPYTGNNAPQGQYQISQELQLLGKTDRWSWVAGLFYFFEHATEANTQLLTFVLPGGQAGLNLQPTAAFFVTSESVAAFGQASYRPPVLDDRLEITAGFRVTRDHKYINQFDQLFGQPTNVGEAQRSFNNLSWLTSLNYKVTEDIMTYARVSTGYKAGGYNARSNLNQYNPEKANAYEIGIKSEWFDRRVRANAALFYTKYKDLQIQQFASGSAGATSLTLNAGKATYKGYELELMALPVEGLTLMADYGYTVPVYQQFLFRDPVTNVVTNVGKEVHTGWVSKQSFHAGAEYVLPPFIPVGTLSARVDFTWKSQRWFHPLNRVNPFNDIVRDPGQRNWSARITLADIALGPAQGEISVWGDNLTNQDRIVSGIDFGGLGFGGVVYGPKRTFGVDLKVSY